MALPVLTLHLARTKLDAYCARKISSGIRNQVRLEVEFADDHATLIESRPYFRDASRWTRLPVARFRFNAASGTWTLHCPNLRKTDHWRPYPCPPNRDLDKLITVLDADGSGVFWG